jgi:hypothetical protein
LRGTGTEDYFNDAWGFRTFTAPSHGVTIYEGPFAGDRVSAYRWHLSDPIRFQKALRVAIEHRGSNVTDEGVKTSSSRERADWVSSAAFWYQTPPVGNSEPLPAAEKRVAPYRILPAKTLVLAVNPTSVVTPDDLGILYAPSKPDAEIEFSFALDKPGRYQVAAVLVVSVFSSRYQPYLDGKPVGPELDLCNEGEDWSWFSFDLHDLAAGKHTLKFIGRGASPRARTLAKSQFAFGLNSVVLLRLENMAGYDPASAAPPKE